MRLLLAGLYYYDVDMVNSLPKVASQLDKLGMVSAANLAALKQLCSSDAARKAALEEVIARHGIEGTPALGVTKRDVAKGLPIRLLHGGDYEAWMRDNELVEVGRPPPAGTV